ncbi:prolyl aminopeptidase [Pseudohongiella sp. O18]|uniref:prolyl aminopeptidase n=1 Tax=Pseudohongiella sp. O18 TaxID=2904248 RepID=UPI00294FF478|nr:prolyl aminopeptidase [Pseudohongiella sp. O18]
MEPCEKQWIQVSPSHSLYVERCGRKGGYPVVFLHGGPGSQINANHRRYFDPEFFDVVLFDQRGCGQSRPAGETRDNNTQALIKDINALREILGIEGRMMLFGGSWGSALALAYARKFPQHVAAMILRGVFLATDEEVEWFTNGLSRFAPAAFQQLTDGMSDNLIQSYHEAVFSSDERLASEAAVRWVNYEMQIMSIGVESNGQSSATELQPSQALLNRARIQLHYLKHHCFMADVSLLNSAASLSMPVTIVQGALDMVCPPITAWQLSEQLPNARFRLVGKAGHSGLSDSMASALREETDAMRDLLRINE